MAEKINAYCSICGKGYYMCLSCKDQMKLNPWKAHTDTAEHYKIYQIIHGYSTGVYKKSEAKSKLKRIDLSDIDSLREHIRKTINDIMGEVETTVEQTVIAQESVTEVEPEVEPIVEVEPVVEQVVSEKQKSDEKTAKQQKFMRNNSVK